MKVNDILVKMKQIYKGVLREDDHDS